MEKYYLHKKNDKHAKLVFEKAQLYVCNSNLNTALGDVYCGFKQYMESEKKYYEAYNMNPSRFYPLYLLMNLYNKNRDNLKTIEVSRKILNKKIKIPSKAIEEIKLKALKTIRETGKHE